MCYHCDPEPTGRETNFKNMRDFLQGKKTYIIGTLMILLGFFTDNNQIIMEGLGFITIRRAIHNK